MIPSRQPVGVRAESITKVFDRNPVLQDISLNVEPGTTTCIIGPSGSGKSTFLRCVNRLEEPTSGRIVIGGRRHQREADIDAICRASAWCSRASTSSAHDGASQHHACADARPENAAGPGRCRRRSHARRKSAC